MNSSRKEGKAAGTIIMLQVLQMTNEQEVYFRVCVGVFTPKGTQAEASHPQKLLKWLHSH